MSITLKAKDLEAAAKLVTSLSGSNVVMIDSGSASVSAAAGGYYLRAMLLECKSTGKWRAFLDASVLQSVLKGGGDCTIDLIDDTVRVKTGRTKAELPQIADGFQPVKFGENSVLVLSARLQQQITEITRNLQLTDVHATSMVEYTHIKLRKGKLTVARFDSYHMAVATSTTKGADMSIMLPAGIFELAAKHAGGKFNLAIDTSAVQIWNDTFEYQAPLVQPERMIALDVPLGFIDKASKGSSVQVKVKTEEFQDALAKCLSIAEHQTGVAVELDGQSIKFSATSEYGKLVTECPGKSSKKLSFVVGPALASDVIRAAKAKTLVLNFTDNACFFKREEDGTNYAYAFLLS